VLNFSVGTDLFVLAEGLSFEALRINSTANGTLLQFAATGEVLAEVFGLIMLLLFWILWLLLSNDKSAFNSLVFADILQGALFKKPRFLNLLNPARNLFYIRPLSYIKWVLSKLLILKK
jgi:hypothetical protein